MGDCRECEMAESSGFKCRCSGLYMREDGGCKGDFKPRKSDQEIMKELYDKYTKLRAEKCEQMLREENNIKRYELSGAITTIDGILLSLKVFISN